MKTEDVRSKRLLYGENNILIGQGKLQVARSSMARISNALHNLRLLLVNKNNYYFSVSFDKNINFGFSEIC